MKKTVLVIGAGGREHAICWKTAQSDEVSTVIAAPGNPGFERAWGGSLLRKLERWPEVKPTDRAGYAALAQRIRERGVDLVIVGPDDPLALGLVDELEKNGITVFGPTMAAARLESSKSFAKEIMKSAGVPTAEFFVADHLEEAEARIRALDWSGGRGWVLKADGLALGKGVIVCEQREEALAALKTLPVGRLLIEEKLAGREVSWLAICDGERACLLDPACDFKRLSDGDLGPNTGGMGAYSPVPGLPDGLEHRVKQLVFEPVLREMKKRGTPFKGVLYAGLMVSGEEVRVLEFNARFGDPETQVLLARMRGDLASWCLAAATGRLDAMPDRVPFERECAVFVVLAAAGYPGKPATGVKVRSGAGSRLPPGIFYAGVSDGPGGLETSGGRVLGVLGMGPSFVEARKIAYAGVSANRFEGSILREDIARDVARAESR